MSNDNYEYDIFTSTNGSNIIDLFCDMKDTASFNGIKIFSDKTTGNLLEYFIYDNCLINSFKHEEEIDDIL
tara:strand:+ start:223 stop:435 length:213 start_codon:yes stop_codon:yes gene_type:complete